jgi:predicted transcriptional regulator
MEKTGPGDNSRLVARIVSSYVSHNRIGAGELPELISGVQRSLASLGSEVLPADEKKVSAVPVKRSVHRDYVVCLDCGFRSQMLRRHLMSAHQLEPAEYRARWKLAPNHPLTAPRYSEHRSGLAKQLGLGRKRAASEVSPAADTAGSSAEVSELGTAAVAAQPTARRPGRPRRSQPTA